MAQSRYLSSFKLNLIMENIIKSIYIASIDSYLGADYIMEVFYCLKIATISRVTIVPLYGKSKAQAYIDIHEWHSTESAYNFIQRLKNPTREARIVHNDDDWWVVEVNNNPSITTCEKMAKFTTVNYIAIDDTKEYEGLPWILSGIHTKEETMWEKIQNNALCKFVTTR